MKHKSDNRSASLEEVVPELLYSFPAFYDNQIFLDNTFQYVRWHWHQTVQYNLVTSGSVLFKVGSTQILLHKGDGLFINAKIVHSGYRVGNESSYAAIQVSPDIIGSKYTRLHDKYVTPLINNTDLPYFLMQNGDPDAEKLLEILWCFVREADTGDYYTLPVLSMLIQLWHETIVYLPLQEDVRGINTVEHERFKEILYYLEINYSRQITLDDISGYVHLSRSECSRLFHSQSGQTLFSYLTRIRIEKAADLLRNTSKPIMEIAMETGYSSQSYFAKSFMREFGVSPREYRKTHR